MSYYEDLQLSPNATQDEIKKAYLRLAKEHHPDKGGDPIEFHRIEKAYSILSNPMSKAKVDAGEEVDEAMSDEKLAIQNINSLMDNIIFSRVFMPEYSDLIVLIKQEINERTIHMRGDLENAEHDLGRVKIVMERLNNSDFLKPYLKQTIHHIENRLEGLKHALRIQDVMLNLLEESVYVVDVDDDDSYLQKEVNNG